MRAKRGVGELYGGAYDGIRALDCRRLFAWLVGSARYEDSKQDKISCTFTCHNWYDLAYSYCDVTLLPHLRIL